MELGEDVKNLMERARLRKEMCSKKRRPAALVDESQIQESHSDIDDSPKRQCVNYVGEDNSIHEDNSDVSECDNKENDRSGSGDSMFVPYTSSSVKGLAALKKPKILNEDVRMKSSDDDKNTGAQVNTRFSSAKSRLASLAANIQQWDDENSSIHSTTNAVPSAKAFSNNTKSAATYSRSSAPAPAKQVRFCPVTENHASNGISTLRHITTAVGDGLTRNQKPGIQKVRVWDQAILTTLESQGFVKSQSKAKLQYEFSKSSTQNRESALMEVDTESDEDVEDNGEVETRGNLKNMNSDSLKTVATPRIQSLPKFEASKPESPKKNYTPVVSFGMDPAELPLSARKALFESTFCGGSNKRVGDVVEQNLSVAQRAAMFEKASKFPEVKRVQTIELVETKKSSPIVPLQVPSPAEVVLSPSKRVGSHTQSLQQQLVDNSASDWRKKDLVAKACDERKNEISALLNHWERVSASSAENNSTDLPPQDNYKKSSSSGSEKDTPVFHYEDTDDDVDSEVIDEKDTDGGKSIDDQSLDNNEDSEAEETYTEQEITDVSSLDDGISFNSESTQSDFIAKADDTCEELNHVLDEAIEQTEEILMPPPLSREKYSKGGSSSSGGSASGSTSSQNRSTESLQSASVMAENYCQNQESDSPLLHTVSFYRRQKQQKRVTPARIIVRRPEVASPPSPQKDSSEALETKLKELQEEVLAQQIIISQTSQALNLCHATEEFFGSTEQVEGERLLLIATQKRMACLNEMQRLKSSHGKIGEAGTGTLIINNLKLPLKRDFISLYQRGDSSDAVHYFLCLVRHRHQVIVTQMLSAQECVKSESLSFTNHITLHNLPPDFSVAFEVYTLQTKKEVLPHDKKYHIKRDHSKMRLTPKGKKSDSKLLSPAISSPGGPNAVRTPSFAVTGYTRFTLQNSNRQSCTLEKVPFSSPLEGVLLLKMQLHAEHSFVEKGFLTMFEDISGFGAWHRRWCVLSGKDLAFWKYPDDEKRKEPILVLDLRQCITQEFRLVSRDLCARPHTFQLLTVRPQEKGDKNTLICRSADTLTTTKYLLSADSKEERIMWCKRLNNAVSNVRKWDPNALQPNFNK